MVEQGLQVKFNENGCYVEDLKDKCRLFAKGNKIGRMSTLDVKMPTTNDNVLYTQKNVVIVDADIWHKRIGQIGRAHV